MTLRITMIEDVRETITRFFQSLPLEAKAELQPITVEPFFNEKIEEAIARFNPNLIILDLRLNRNEDSGFRVLRKLKTSEKIGHIPVVVCSMYIGSGQNDPAKNKAIEWGADAALPKIPFPKPEEFLQYARMKED